jgi:hypothetical protein
VGDGGPEFSERTNVRTTPYALMRGTLTDTGHASQSRKAQEYLMRRLVLSTTFALATAALPAVAVELNYTWHKGDVHRFQYEDSTTMDMKMEGMGGMPGMGPSGQPVRVKSVFTEKVLSVGPDGKADIELTVEKLDVYQGDQKMAALDKIPPAARVVKAELDRKGHAHFYRMVTVYVQNDHVYVGIEKAQVSKNGVHMKASGGGPGGGEEVEIVASVDPKTGRITASATATAKPPPALKKVEVKEDAPHVDVLPKEIFEMMVLPDGDMAEGSHQELQTPVGRIEITMAKLQGSVAQLQMKMAGKEVGSNTAPAGEPQDEAQPDDQGMPSMPGMMPGMLPTGVSPMPGHKPRMPGQHQEEAPSMGMKMDADISVGFDVAAGKLLKMEGTIDSNTSMGGMGSMKVHSTPKLTRL